MKNSRHKTKLTRILSRTRERIWIRYWKNERNKNILFYDLSLLLTYMIYYLIVVANWNTISPCFSRKFKCQISKLFENKRWIVTKESMRHQISTSIENFWKYICSTKRIETWMSARKKNIKNMKCRLCFEKFHVNVSITCNTLFFFVKKYNFPTFFKQKIDD